MRSLLALLLIANTAFAARPVPPADVLARFEERTNAEIAIEKAKYERQSVVIVEQEPPEPPSAPDERCEVVQKYARAIGLLRGAAIPISHLNISPVDVEFDIGSIQDVIINNTRMDWGSTVALVRWNCDHLGYDNLSVALDAFRTQPDLPQDDSDDVPSVSPLPIQTAP